MIEILVAVFVLLHGFVHLLYLGQSLRLFELQPAMTWPDGSWLLPRSTAMRSARLTAAALCIVATAGFVASGVAILLDQSWQVAAVTTSAAISNLLYVGFWNGRFHALPNQGAIGILINIALFAYATMVV